mmetsp:Transcript_8535/g.11754  ORF Transcript_8535/g.11754 Transcript_8535/m.11754 type:complete len:91 (+) Transcript_8535:140-412(+)
MNNEAKHEVKQLRLEEDSKRPAKNEARERILRYYRRDKAFYANEEKKDAPIKYDFQDPVLNKEFVENMTKKNQIQYRMKKDPSYATRVVA